MTRALVEQLLEETVAARQRTPDDRFTDAATMVREVTLTEDFPTFFTVPGYVDHLVTVTRC